MSNPTPETQAAEGLNGQPVGAEPDPWLTGLHAFQDTFVERSPGHEDLTLWEPGVSSQNAEIGLSPKGSDQPAVVVFYDQALDTVQLHGPDNTTMTAYGASQRLGKSLDETIALVQAAGTGLKDGVTAHQEAGQHAGQHHDDPQAAPAVAVQSTGPQRQPVRATRTTGASSPAPRQQGTASAPSAAEIAQTMTTPSTPTIH